MRNPLDLYDSRPRSMTNYLQQYGWHFSKRAYEFASRQMKRYDQNGNIEKVKPYTRDEVESILKTYKVELENNIGYDFVYVAQMCKADFLQSSIPDEKHLALYVKDVIDDVDIQDGTIMRRWYATMVANGIPIEWDDII